MVREQAHAVYFRRWPGVDAEQNQRESYYSLVPSNEPSSGLLVLPFEAYQSFEKNQSDSLSPYLFERTPASKETVVSLMEEWPEPGGTFSCKPLVSKEEYLEKVSRIKAHIYRGDIYEVNFCIPFMAVNVQKNPLQVFNALDAIAGNPYACLIRLGDEYILCSSPERFLIRNGQYLATHPIKGTRKRGKSVEEDEQLKRELFLSEKERNENVMIVDLVRNDLSRVAEKGSVKVETLFGIHSFPTVHQMESVVSCTLPASVSLRQILEATFPMGSMTGAPKHSSLEIIKREEHGRRHFYSGTVALLDEGNKLDSCVLIRSIFLNKDENKAIFWAGSAITALCEPEKEYEECLLKAESMIQALS